MQTVVGVRFKKAGKIYYFDPGKLEIAVGDGVIVETARGLEYGLVVSGPRDTELPAPVKVVQRKATASDEMRLKENKRREQEAFVVGEKKIAEHNLAMNLVEVEYTFDLSKIVFYFTADGRVDFRELVKDLASVFRTRIELRQIGVRDEAKHMGGIGGCGRPMCCAAFLGDFEPVSIRMAKEQNLSLNPTKISGVCGRLMCCLKYESDYYEENAALTPHIVKQPVQGTRVVSAEGEGKVISVNVQRRTATILLDDGQTMVAAWEDVVEAEDGEDGFQRKIEPKERPERTHRSHGEEKTGGRNNHRPAGRRPKEERERPPRELKEGQKDDYRRPRRQRSSYGEERRERRPRNGGRRERD